MPSVLPSGSEDKLQKYADAINKEALDSSIPDALWARNVEFSTDQSLRHNLIYKEAPTGNVENWGLFWWHTSVDLETGLAKAKGAIKIVDASKLNAQRRLLGKKEIAKYFSYPAKETIEPHLAAIDEETLKKICGFYDVPLKKIHKPARLDLGLWPWVRDSCPKLVLTEGLKKELSVLDCGIVCISIPGVYNGLESKADKKQRILDAGTTTNKDRKGRVLGVRLSKALDQLLGSTPKTVVLAFDSDLWEKHEVRLALSRQARALISAGHTVEVANWRKIAGSDQNLYRSDTAKGIDDLKTELGPQAVINCYRNSQPWDEFESNLLEPNKFQLWVNELSKQRRILTSGRATWEFSPSKGFFVEMKNPDIVKRWIAEFAAQTKDIVDDEESVTAGKTAATPRNLAGILQLWRDLSQVESQDVLNRSGLLPVKNGFLEMTGGKATLHPYPNYLTESESETYFTYQCPVEWDPESWPLDRCLETLSPLLASFADEQQGLTFLKLMSCCLDVEGIRARHTRIIKAIILLGTGSNGKDMWRSLFNETFAGQGMTNFKITDFRAHDRDTSRFTLNGIQNGKINWGTENEKCNLEIQSLKAVITGDPIIVAQKYQVAGTIIPQCVLVFNQNERGFLSSDRNSNASRWVMINFPKTFVDNPTGPLELKANPLYRDRQFVIENFCPALLHGLYWLHQDVWENGIDTSCFDENRQEMIRESNHLYDFIEAELIPDKDGKIWTGDLHKRLIEYYEATGQCKPDWESGEKWPDVNEYDPPHKTVDKLNNKLKNMGYSLITDVHPKLPSRKVTYLSGYSLYKRLQTLSRQEITEILTES